MHDLISDLAQTIAKEICYNYEAMLKDDMPSLPCHQKVRHASFSHREGIGLQAYEIYTRTKRLRTILDFPIFRINDYPGQGVSEYKTLCKLLAQSKCARVLSLTISEMLKLPNSIGDLIHLRYINLSATDIQRLPESVSSLLNLQTLLLTDCQSLQKLPDKIRNLVNLRHLDISLTNQLKKLPSGIGMLTNLQTLSKFIVKEGHGTTIAELKNLNNLRGSLFIEGLENVEDVKSANLKRKQGLEKLKFEWNDQGKNDMSVLESLEPPHQNLKRLTILSYGGAEFPSWMTNIPLVSLELRDCKETKVLPPLGHLCSLKKLCIIGLKAVKTMGVGFYGNVVVPFPSLERLEIGKMSEWREWSHGNMGGEGFPNLQELKLYDCPKLTGNFPSGFPSTSLRKLKILNCGNLLSLPDGWTMQEDNTRQSESESHLEELEIVGCSSLEYFQRNFKLPTSLRKLKIINCANLLSLLDGLMVQDDKTRQSESESESHLEELEIVGCQGLTSFPAGKFPAALKILKIGGPIRMQLESAISEKNTALETIEISHNDDIKAFPSTDCFPSLKYLQIKSCQNLSLLPIRMLSHFPSLQKLSILFCPNVGFLIEDGGLPRNLTYLTIKLCENMRPPIPIAEWGLGMLSSLDTLIVGGRCPATADVVSYPDDNCCWLPTSLRNIFIRDFVSLESVSMGLQMLTSLYSLDIIDCPKLRSLPKEALPCSLRQILISGCPLLKKELPKGSNGLRVIYYD